MSEIEYAVLGNLKPADMLSFAIHRHISPAVLRDNLGDFPVMQLECACERPVEIRHITPILDIHGDEIDIQARVVIVVGILIVDRGEAARYSDFPALKVDVALQYRPEDEEVADVDITGVIREIILHNHRLLDAAAIRLIGLGIHQRAVILTRVAAFDL